MSRELSREPRDTYGCTHLERRSAAIRIRSLLDSMTRFRECAFPLRDDNRNDVSGRNVRFTR
jgi:hypothetical protein